MIELEDVYPWLNKYGTSHIHPSSERLIGQMRQALGEGRPDEARGLLQQLYDFACKLRDDKEVTEIFAECAHSSFMLNGMAEAETILIDAVSRAWSDLHTRAVIQWMLGCVQWQSLPTRQEAVVSWRNSLTDFERLTRQPGLSYDQHAWYEETRGQLERSLLDALEQVGSYVDMDGIYSSGKKGKEFVEQPVATETPTTEEPAESQKVALPQVSATSENYSSDILQLFTISEEIPAGDFGPSGIDPFPIGTVEIDQLSINGRPYRIYSTRGHRIINLPLDQKFLVLKVKGDSMDQENITGKDFVILRRVDLPSNGDIVMAEIVGIDSHATLKLFYKDNKSITLKPHSSNPIHKPFVFKNVNEGFYIRGVVVAVLKPV